MTATEFSFWLLSALGFVTVELQRSPECLAWDSVQGRPGGVTVTCAVVTILYHLKYYSTSIIIWQGYVYSVAYFQRTC